MKGVNAEKKNSKLIGYATSKLKVKALLGSGATYITVVIVLNQC